MSVLAFKALDYGADKLPDKLFEAIPGGFFTPSEKKQSKKKSNRRPVRDSQRSKSEHGEDRSRRRSQRDRTPPTDYSDYTSYDESDYAPEQRFPAQPRSLSRGRHSHRSSGFDGEMDSEHRPHFPPPPTAEYSTYSPQDYASPPPHAAAAHYAAYQPRASSARQDPPLPHQVNNAFRSRSATVPTGRPQPTPLQMLRSNLVGRSPLNMSPSFFPTSPSPTSPAVESLRAGTPLGASFMPSYEPPLAALLYRPATNPPQPMSQTAARYTPGPGYAPSPANVNAAIPPPPAAEYAPYHPADYVGQNPGYHAPDNAYPSPPPFYRQASRSQPSLPQYQHPDSQLTAYDSPPDRHGSSSSSRRHRHGDDKRHRTRSAGHHGRSRSRITDKVRDRLEGMDLQDKNLAASVGGALAGGLAGRAVGHGTLSTLIGAGIGAFGGRELERRNDK